MFSPCLCGVFWGLLLLFQLKDLQINWPTGHFKLLVGVNVFKLLLMSVHHSFCPKSAEVGFNLFILFYFFFLIFMKAAWMSDTLQICIKLHKKKKKNMCSDG